MMQDQRQKQYVGVQVYMNPEGKLSPFTILIGGYMFPITSVGKEIRPITPLVDEYTVRVRKGKKGRIYTTQLFLEKGEKSADLKWYVMKRVAA